MVEKLKRGLLVGLFLLFAACVCFTAASCRISGESGGGSAEEPDSADGGNSDDTGSGGDSGGGEKYGSLCRPGETVSVTAGAEETQYLKVETEESRAYDIILEGTGDISAKILYGRKDNTVAEFAKGAAWSVSYYFYADGIYFVEIYNGGDRAQEVRATLKETDALTLGEGGEYSVAGVKYFSFTSPVSSEVKFAADGEEGFKIALYREDGELLAWADGLKRREFSYFTEKNTTYYLRVKNTYGAEESVTVRTALNPVLLEFGRNYCKQTAAESCYKFVAPLLSAEYSVCLSANTAAIYDAEGKEVVSDGGRCFLEAGAAYYMIIDREQSEFTVDIDLACVGDTEGTIPETGGLYVKFVPSGTAEYAVTGADAFQWYNGWLNPAGKYLYAGNTYYLKLSGAPGSVYSVKEVYTEIGVGQTVNLYEGGYEIGIETGGEYAITFYCGRENEIQFLLYDADGELIREYSGGAGAVSAALEAGRYYFTLKVADKRSSVGVVFNPQENEAADS